MNYFETQTKYGVTFIQAEGKGGEFMKVNIGETERVVRALVGIAVLTIALYYRSWWGFVGLEVLATGIFGWSPIYKLSEMSWISKTHHELIR